VSTCLFPPRFIVLFFAIRFYWLFGHSTYAVCIYACIIIIKYIYHVWSCGEIIEYTYSVSFKWFYAHAYKKCIKYMYNLHVKNNEFGRRAIFAT
jgi:phage-related holin